MTITIFIQVDVKANRRGEIEQRAREESKTFPTWTVISVWKARTLLQSFS